ncbi:MAG TPA: hypothetical protein DCX77_06815 [Acidimicrobiaceae bacterium]|nr:hypothetical protein [Acidimicrobiaceae bacterium]
MTRPKGLLSAVGNPFVLRDILPSFLARPLGLICVLLLTASACSGAGTSLLSPSPTSTTTTVAVAPTPTTVPPPTTTTNPPAPTTTTAPPSPVAQFTGEQLADPITRPAFLVKIDNHQTARPQWGINQADVVFEELVEGNITRFAAIFHSRNVTDIGPVRSARTGDFELLSNLNTPLFGNSGGNPTVMRLLNDVDMVLVGDTNVGRAAYRRNSDRKAPHNLLTGTGDIYAAADGRGGTPPQMFSYRDTNEELPVSAEALDAVEIDYGGYRITYHWDEVFQGWARTQQDTEHVDYDGVQIAPENVIIQFVKYGQSVAYAGSPEVKVLGRGEAWVLTDGHIIEATWNRPTSLDITEFRDADGATIKLTPGRTWIALPRSGTASIVEVEQE